LSAARPQRCAGEGELVFGLTKHGRDATEPRAFRQETVVQFFVKALW